MARTLYGLNQTAAKDKVIQLIAQGMSVKEAMAVVARAPKTYENWRAQDPEFAARIDQARGRKARADRNGQDDSEIYNLTFADWRKRFLGRETYPHQQMWIDVLEGKEPDLFHTAITYRPRNPDYLLINTPPFHAKSKTITQEYVVYKLCMNPAFRVMIISKTAEMAAKFLFSIRTMLTSPQYMELIATYAPKGGWKPQRGEGSWASKMIYLADRGLDANDPAAADPSVQAVGIGGQVYGARADLIILDDAVDDNNAAAYEKQFDWLTRTVMSRAKDGKILIVGTRVAPADLYSHLLNDEIYVGGRSPWTYIAQPAVLAFAEHEEDWVTLWPRSAQPLDEAGGQDPDEDGMYAAWDGPALSTVRSRNRAAVWALVYQQQQVSDDMTFNSVNVWGCVDRRRWPGPLKAGAVGHPKFGSEGMQIIGSIDPAGTGEAFILVYALDRRTKDRWVLNCWMGSDTIPSWYQDRIQQITPEYGVQEWVIEAQGYSNWLYHDETIMRYCRERGIKISPHYTGRNKMDPDFGVASMAPLFGTLKKTEDGRSFHNNDGIIHLPNPDKHPGVKALIDQLITWIPGKSGAKLRQDGPMALWFAEIRARLYVYGADKPPTTHVKNKYLSRRAASRQYVTVAD